MHNDKIRLFDRLVQKLCYRPQDERVADAVEAILAQTIGLGNFLVDWVGAYSLGDCLVETRVEKGDAWNFGELPFAQADYLQRGEIVAFGRGGVSGVLRTKAGI